MPHTRPVLLTLSDAHPPHAPLGSRGFAVTGGLRRKGGRVWVRARRGGSRVVVTCPSSYVRASFSLVRSALPTLPPLYTPCVFGVRPPLLLPA